MTKKEKTITVTFTEGQLLALWYLAAAAEDGWGDPFKDWYEVDREDVEPDKEIKLAYEALCKALKDNDIKAS